MALVEEGIQHPRRGSSSSSEGPTLDISALGQVSDHEQLEQTSAEGSPGQDMTDAQQGAGPSGQGDRPAAVAEASLDTFSDSVMMSADGPSPACTGTAAPIAPSATIAGTTPPPQAPAAAAAADVTNAATAMTLLGQSSPLDPRLVLPPRAAAMVSAMLDKAAAPASPRTEGQAQLARVQELQGSDSLRRCDSDEPLAQRLARMDSGKQIGVLPRDDARSGAAKSGGEEQRPQKQRPQKRRKLARLSELQQPDGGAGAKQQPTPVPNMSGRPAAAAPGALPTPKAMQQQPASSAAAAASSGSAPAADEERPAWEHPPKRPRTSSGEQPAWEHPPQRPRSGSGIVMPAVQQQQARGGEASALGPQQEQQVAAKLRDLQQLAHASANKRVAQKWPAPDVYDDDAAMDLYLQNAKKHFVPNMHERRLAQRAAEDAARKGKAPLNAQKQAQSTAPVLSKPQAKPRPALAVRKLGQAQGVVRKLPTLGVPPHTGPAQPSQPGPAGPHRHVAKVPGGGPNQANAAAAQAGPSQPAAAVQADAQEEEDAEEAQKGPRMYANGVGLVKTLLSAAQLRAAKAALTPAELDVEMRHRQGEEPWRSFGIMVNDRPMLAAADVNRVQAVQHAYWAQYKIERANEAERARAAQGKKVQQRPDLKAWKALQDQKLSLDHYKTAGHVPGHVTGGRYFVRAEVAALGLHPPHMNGIHYASDKDVPADCPTFALSCVTSGQYANDVDSGDIIIYTGQGGGNARSFDIDSKDQQLTRGNKALVGNIELGIPVRMLRKNPDEGSDYGQVLINDGLYDVIKYEEGKNASGHRVYLYHMHRRPGQPELISKTVFFGGTSAPRGHTIEKRSKAVNVVCKDISGSKEAIPIPAINEVDDDNPFKYLNSSGEAWAAASKQTRERGEIGVCQPLLRYVTENVRGSGVPQPKAAQLPDTFRGRPHDYLEFLNFGRLPYIARRSGSDEMILQDNQAMVFECGPWTGCRHGKKCPQALTQQGLRWRLEVYKTPDKGWAVRSWDTIPQGSYVTSYVGKVQPLQEEVEDDTFLYDLCKRADMTWQNVQLDDMDPAHEVRYLVDAGEVGGVARYLNHSCDGNQWVQPVLTKHGDVFQPNLCFFAQRNIPPWTELTYDYGWQYVTENLEVRYFQQGNCHCGAAGCRGNAGAAAAAAQQQDAAGAAAQQQAAQGDQ